MYNSMKWLSVSRSYQYQQQSKQYLNKVKERIVYFWITFSQSPMINWEFTCSHCNRAEWFN